MLHSGKDGSQIRTIGRFKDIAYSPSYRSDGKLVVAGSEDGVVRVFDVNSRIILRMFKGHKEAVKSTFFLPNNTQVVSCSDDKSVRVWDMPTQKQVHCFVGHADYIRSSCAHATNPDLFMTTSYDHSIRLWDVREGKTVLKLDHGAPVEAVVPYPGGGMMAAAGDNFITVWDLVAGARFRKFSNHQKTITSLAMDGEGTRLLSGSLDHHVKFYDISDYSVTHSFKHASPVMSVGVSGNDRILATGLLDGTVSVRRRIVKADEVETRKKAMIRTGTYKYYVRGAQNKAAEDDFTVDAVKKKKLQEYDHFLKKFQYGAALDAALKTRHAVVITSLIEELRYRDGLVIALRNRDPQRLAAVLSFLVRHITNPHYSAVLVETASSLLDIYGSKLGQSTAVDELFLKLRTKMDREQSFQKNLLRLIGTMDSVVASSAIRRQRQVTAVEEEEELVVKKKVKVQEE